MAKNCRNKKVNKENTNKKKTTNEEANVSKQATLLCNNLLLGNTQEDEWYIDSGASAHMTRSSIFIQNTSEAMDKEVTIADKTRISVENQGDMYLDVSGK